MLSNHENHTTNNNHHHHNKAPQQIPGFTFRLDLIFLQILVPSPFRGAGQSDIGSYLAASVLRRRSPQGNVTWILLVGCLLACLTSQRHASASQGRLCSDNCKIMMMTMMMMMMMMMMTIVVIISLSVVVAIVVIVVAVVVSSSSSSSLLPLSLLLLSLLLQSLVLLLSSSLSSPSSLLFFFFSAFPRKSVDGTFILC